MKTSRLGQAIEIRRTDPDRHKYDSAMAEFLDVLGMDYADEDTGDTEFADGHAMRFGRRILWTDDRGFVACDTYDAESDARSVMDQYAGEYAAWLDWD
jgi:hypothetical protein